MRGVGLLGLVLCVPLVFAGCGGKTHGDGDAGEAGDGGTSGAGAAAGSGGNNHGGAGAAGKATAGAGRGGAGSGGTAGGPVASGGAGDAGPEAGAPAVGGSAGRGTGGAAGRGAAGKGGGAGKAAGGTGSSMPGTYAPPAMGQTWSLESGDPSNSTPPVLLAVDDDLVLAGASADPATVGVTAFDDGIQSEAFVMRMSNGKKVWSKPLKAAGLPWAIARSGDDVIIVAPNVPDQPQVSTAYVSKDVYVAKVGLDGTVRYEKTVTFDYEDTYTYGLAVDATGDFFLAGGIQVLDDQQGIVSHPILVKCDADANKLWEKPFTHPGNQSYANAVAVLSSGDVVMTGDFDQSIDFGGTSKPLSATADPAGLPSGFMARFTPDGDTLWASEFGSTGFAVGISLAALADDGFLLSGGNALDLELGGKTAAGAPFTPSDAQPFPPSAAFVARLDGDGKASWLVLEQASQYGKVVATDGTGTVFLGGAVDTGMTGGGAKYLRTYDLATGDALQVLAADDGEGIESSSLSVAPSGSVWVSGQFAAKADFGNANLVQTSDVGVFLLRIDPQ